MARIGIGIAMRTMMDSLASFLKIAAGAIFGATGAQEMAETRVFWTSASSASTAISGTATSVTSGPMSSFTVVSVGGDFANLRQQSQQANSAFEAAKSEFQAKHGFEWAPTVVLTSPAAMDDASRLIALRDASVRAFAALLAASRR